MSDSFPPYELWPARLLCPWDFSDKNTGVGSHSLLQGIFLTQVSNLALLHSRQILYHLSYQGSPFQSQSLSSLQDPTQFAPNSVLLKPHPLPLSPCGHPISITLLLFTPTRHTATTGPLYLLPLLPLFPPTYIQLTLCLLHVVLKYLLFRTSLTTLLETDLPNTITPHCPHMWNGRWFSR